MGVFRDLTGQRFGRLVVVDLAARENRATKWRCRCDCGALTVKRANDLTSGKTKSCGCLRKETASAQALSMSTHGMTKSRLYVVWKDMKQRCKENPRYAEVFVCEDWSKFESFYKWAIENGYADNLTIDRIDTHGNYEPSNCRWATYKEQSNNRKNNIRVFILGEEKTLAEWCDTFGVNYQTAYKRFKSGVRGSSLFTSI